MRPSLSDREHKNPIYIQSINTVGDSIDSKKIGERKSGEKFKNISRNALKRALVFKMPPHNKNKHSPMQCKLKLNKLCYNLALSNRQLRLKAHLRHFTSKLSQSPWRTLLFVFFHLKIDIVDATKKFNFIQTCYTLEHQH